MAEQVRIPRLRDRIIAALEDPKTTDSQVQVIVEHIRDNLKECHEGERKSFTLFLGAVLLYTLIVSTQVTKVTVGGVEILGTSFAITFVPMVAAFCFYRAVVFDASVSMCEKFLLQYYRLKLPTFHENQINMLTSYPSVLEGDSTIQQIIRPIIYTPFNLKMSFGDYWVMSFALLCVLLPFGWFIVSAFWTFWLHEIPLWSRIVGVGIPAAFYVRSGCLIVASFKSGI